MTLKDVYSHVKNKHIVIVNCAKNGKCAAIEVLRLNIMYCVSQPSLCLQ